MLAFILCICSCITKNNTGGGRLQYLHTVQDQDKTKKSKHIELIENYKVCTGDFNYNDLDVADDRIIINKLGYNKKQLKAIIKEYLSYGGINDTSDKPYAMHIGTSYTRYKMSEQNLSFPVEVEALYSLSIMLLEYNVPIGPVLIDTITGKNCNYDNVAMKNIYRIYRQWYEHCEENDFRIIKWPLENTRYKWLSQNGVPIERYLKK